MALPRHEVARVSEVLQAQLLQPASLTPVPPRLAETDLFILEGAGPDRVGFNEFNPLFSRNRLAVQFSGAAAAKASSGTRQRSQESGIGSHSASASFTTIPTVFERTTVRRGTFTTSSFRLN